MVTYSKNDTPDQLQYNGCQGVIKGVSAAIFTIMESTRKNTAAPDEILRKPYVWCFTTYFTEGLPYTIIQMLPSLYLRTLNVSLESIGLTSFFSLPWIVKFLWAPFVDRFGTRRLWLLGTQAVLAALFLFAGIGAGISDGVTAVMVLFLIGAFFAATHDTAIDGYYMAALDAEKQATFIGFRVTAYRIAMMTGTGLIATIGTRIGWKPAFLTAGGLMAAFFLFHRIFLPKCEEQTYSIGAVVTMLLNGRFLTGTLVVTGTVVAFYFGVKSPWYEGVRKTVPFFKGLTFAGWISILLLIALTVVAVFHRKLTALLARHPDSFYSKSFFSFIDRRGIGIILSFVILMRTGEFLLTKMTSSFMVDLGIKVHYGWMQAAVGLPASIVGAMIGGYLISRFGLRRMLFPILFFQNGSNIVYMLLAFSLNHFVTVNTGNGSPEPIGLVNLVTVAAVQGFDQLSGGLGTAVLMTFLMKLCKGPSKAAHYAIGSGLMSISGLFTGVASGFLAARLGYGWFFGVSFLMSVPGMVLAFPAVKLLEEKA